MYEFRVHTLVDITENGSLSRPFPFNTMSGDLIHDRQSLMIARNQNSNFNTMLQLLQMRGNVTWETTPQRMELQTLGNHGFGSIYEGKHTSWHFSFFTEQTGVYGEPTDPTGQLIEDFNLVPIINFCKETATFPSTAFLTQNPQTINTYFSYAGESNK